MFNIIRAISLLFLSVLSFNSFAAFPAPSSLRYQVISLSYVIGEFDNFSDIQPFLISRTLASYPNSTGPYSLELNSSLANPGDQSSGKFRYYLNGSSYSTNYNFKYANVSSCPANSSPSGSQCTCNSGYEEKNGNSCVLPEPPDPCEGLEAYCSSKQNSNFDWQVKGKSKSRQWTCQSAQSWVSGIGDGFTGYVDDFPGCSKGCTGRTSGFDTSVQDDAGDWFTQGQGKYVGSTCEPSVIADLNGEQGDEETPLEVDKNTDKTCSNGFKGTVNGVSVCVPPKATSGVSELETTDNGDGTKTESKTQVQCENGVCSITKTTTTTNNETNDVVSNSSVTTTVDQSSYCSQNPTAGVCKNEAGEKQGGGEFSGSCEAGFKCDGDAIMCAVAKEQHKRNCEIFSETPESKIYADAIAKGSSRDVTADLPGNKTINVGEKLSKENILGAAVCISDLTINVLGQSIDLELSMICPYLEYLGWIIVAIASIVAFRIVSGTSSKEE